MVDVTSMKEGGRKFHLWVSYKDAEGSAYHTKHSVPDQGAAVAVVRSSIKRRWLLVYQLF